MDRAEIKKRFTHHPPDAATEERHVCARGAVTETAEVLNELLPEGREKSLAITHLETALFWANAAIAREGK